jgi:hypothetical protein
MGLWGLCIVLTLEALLLDHPTTVERTDDLLCECAVADGTACASGFAFLFLTLRFGGGKSARSPHTTKAKKRCSHMMDFPFQADVIVLGHEAR